MAILKGVLAGLVLLVLWGLLIIKINQRGQPGFPLYALDFDTLWVFCQMVFGVGLGVFLPVGVAKLWAWTMHVSIWR